MARVPVPLGPNVDKAKTTQGGGATITNGYIEKTEGGKTGFSINTRPRLKLFADLGAGNGIRGSVLLNNALYIVAKEQLYKINSGGTASSLGNILGQKTVTMSLNRKAPYRQITITADTKNYIVENDVLSEIADLDLPSGVHSNCNSNGFTVYGINDGLAYASDENNSGSINALAFAEAERSSDGGIRVLEFGEDFWYFGEKTREVFRFVGGTSAFPFEPLLGAGLGEGGGCAARYSPVILGSVVAWVNDYFQVVMSGGGIPQKISTHAVDRDIERAVKLGLADEITGFAFDTEGHQFYVIRCSLWCHMFDLTTGFWFPLKSYLSDTFKCGHYIYAFNRDLVMDVVDGKIYELTFDREDDDGDPCILSIETSPLNAFPDGYICDAFYVDGQRGMGMANGAAHVQDPQALLTVSRDGGMTWGPEYARSAGQQGKYGVDIRFNRLGACNGSGMAFRLSFPEPVQRSVFQAVAKVRPLRN